MFTNNEIDFVLGHLNYPVLSWSITTVTARLSELSNLSLSAENRVREIINTLNTIQTERNNLRLQVGVREDGTSLAATAGTSYFQGGIRSDLNAEYKYWQNQLAIATSLNVWNDVVCSCVVRS
jgi:hypothetical protein